MALRDEIESRARSHARPSVVLIPAFELEAMLSTVENPALAEEARKDPKMCGVPLRASKTLKPGRRIWCW